MTKTPTILAVLIGLGGLFYQCKDKYVSPYKSPTVGYLVVEGFISGNAPIQYTLSRTLPLPGDSTIPKETGASVEVEGSDNSSISLIEQGNGRYSSVDTPMLNASVRYRLRIHTSEGEDYLSDFAPFRPSPPIDSINWINGPTGLTIYANTHDPANATRYYEWNFVETWEYRSAQQADYEFDTTTNEVIRRPDSGQIYVCWHTDTASNILLGTSIKLAQDVISMQPLQTLTENGWQVSVLYSVLVYQWALTDSAYNYANIMKTNTESLGSIFDVQPSILVGNIHCLTKTTEQVLGYISAGTIQQQRIWIYNTQVPLWQYSYSCPEADSVVPLISVDSLKAVRAFLMGDEIPLDPHITPPSIFVDGWTSNFAFCIDCRTQGGTNIRPSYWPNY
jgi:Domain of unknown function (DUF4249)